ncbi:50S ribosomal protein L25 [Candidatus Enterovibrio altilux]|uniref:50S ribosomal protein L25 n=1 Tax=Candidatus Enterovibrio altilux TaxID=1927128 RepID=UPI000BBBA0BD|nr:50S ribosomal protein L25 [Candidatus Enterovibrio luxaltus]
MKFEAIIRTEHGTGASRRLRHSEQLPAVIYGGGIAPIAISLQHNTIINQMDKAKFYEGITLIIDGQEVNVKPQDIQRHPFKPKVMHMDFIRI